MLTLLKGLKPYRKLMVVIVVLIGLQASADLLLPYLMSEIVNSGIVNGDIGFILGRGGLMILIALVGMVCTLSMMYLVSRVSVGFCRDLREKIFVSVTGLSVHEVGELGTASLITRSTNDISQIQLVLALGLRLLVSTPIMIVGATWMSYRQDASVAVILWVVIPSIIISILGIAFVTMPMFKETQRRLDRVNLVIREKLNGIRVIRVFNKEKSEAARFNDASLSLAKISIRANRIMGLMMPLMNLFLNLAIVSVVWLGGRQVALGNIQVGNLMAIIQYFTQLLISLLLLSMVLSMLPRAHASAIRIREVLEIATTIQDPKRAKPGGLIPAVEFLDVSFAYSGSEEEVLSKINFSAQPGEVTAIIGGTGAGKTTLLNMIPRFFDATAGTVKIAGIDVLEQKQSQIRSIIGYAPQKAQLFSGSIRDNLKFGNPEATDKELLKALTTAQAYEFVESLPAGVETRLNQGATNLSGGQKQRLSIARMVVKKPKIYLFDDSFSALDYKTDKQLRQALKKETVDAAVIIVAQRVSTIQDAHKIIVLEEGRVVGTGTHDELLKNCGVYQEIVDSQIGSSGEVG